VVIANKADLLGEDGDSAEVEAAKMKLRRLEEFVGEELGNLDVVPVSAKFTQNLGKVVRLMRKHVEEARAESNQQKASASSWTLENRYHE